MLGAYQNTADPLYFISIVMLRICLVRLNLDFMIQNVREYPDNMKHNGLCKISSTTTNID